MIIYNYFKNSSMLYILCYLCTDYVHTYSTLLYISYYIQLK